MTKKAKQAAPIAYPDSPQRDHVSEGCACPTCGRPWEGRAVKVCHRCGQTIRGEEKHKLVPRGPAIFSFEHKVCPTAEAL